MFSRNILVIVLLFFNFFEVMDAIKNKNAEIQTILQNMTLKQKIGQMTQVSFHFFCFEMLFL
jgi:hypothetical protein